MVHLVVTAVQVEQGAVAVAAALVVLIVVLAVVAVMAQYLFGLGKKLTR